MMIGGGNGMGGMAAGRVPTWRERENNRRRERRRRAIAAKIFSGLRAQGNYALPKHCDNNEVLKKLADEAGWTVEPDGTTYRKGTQPPPAVRTAPVSPTLCSPFQMSPRSSGSPHMTLGGGGGGYYGGVEGSSLIPWLNNLSSGPGFASSSKYPSYFDGSMSAPVSPPSGSPPRIARLKTGSGWGEYPAPLPRQGFHPTGRVDYSVPNSRPSSPREGFAPAPNPYLLAGFGISSAGPSSPTHNLMGRPPNPFAAAFGRLASAAATAPTTRVHTPAQSGTCSPVGGAPAIFQSLVPMDDSGEDDFEFGSEEGVNAWEGEEIGDVPDEDELELRLGIKKTRGAGAGAGAGAADNA